MNPLRPLFGRITINSKRTDLGHAPISQLFLRATQIFQSQRSSSPDITIVMEVSAAKLPDSSIMNREMQIEQSLAAQIVTNPDEESPFEGITIGRVTEVMATREYEQMAHICIPANREGLTVDEIENIKYRYRIEYPDCAPHFPRWVES